MKNKIKNILIDVVVFVFIRISTPLIRVV